MDRLENNPNESWEIWKESTKNYFMLLVSYADFQRVSISHHIIFNFSSKKMIDHGPELMILWLGKTNK